MDNFDMHEFFEKIGVPDDVIQWSDGCYVDLPDD